MIVEVTGGECTVGPAMARNEPAARDSRPGPVLASRIARAAAHALVLLAPAVPIAGVAGEELGRGWTPMSDDAALAWRSFDVLSAHPPLVGAFNEASVSAARPVFDLGPLQYFLLAVPVRLDPVGGLLWGAAVLAVLIAAVAVEASWRAGGALPALSVSAGFVVLAATQPRVVLNLPWNPNFGLYAFAGTVVLCIVVATGRTGFWPLAVLEGSLAAQCHLVYALGALASVAIGLGLGLLARHRGRAGLRRGLLHGVLGAGLGVVSLLPPIIQQLGSPRGNLSLLVADLGRHGARLGIGVGLEAVSRSALWPPAWAHRAPPVSGAGWYEHFLHALFTGSPAAGLAVVLASLAVGLGALFTGRAGLGGLGICSAAAALLLAWTTGSIAVSQMGVLTYLDAAYWPVGMMLDATLLAGAGTAVVAYLRSRQGTRAHIRAHQALALGLVPLVAWSLSVDLPMTASSAAVIGGWRAARATGGLASAIERRPAPHGVLVEPGVGLLPGGLDTWALVEAVAFRLEADGHEAALPRPMAPEFGPDATAPARAGVVLVDPAGRHGWRLAWVARPRRVTLFGVSP